MNLKLRYTKFTVDGIIAVVTQEDGSQVCVTLSHAYQRDDPQVSNSAAAFPDEQYIPKTPPGVFECVRGKHRLHGMTEDFETFEITGVTGHLNLLFHWGNYNENSDGCNLTGDAEAQGDHAGRKHVEMVTNSRAAFARFMALQEGVERFNLTVEGPAHAQ